MRADRLISILMLLQARGKCTAPEMASELEVSTRTIYRDIDALCNAGIPIYGESGPDGGFSLIDRYRTQLTGLTEDELRALFVLGIPSYLAQLGLSNDFRAVLRKFIASLPASRREEQERIRQRIYIDPADWQQTGTTSPILQKLYQAILHNERIQIKRRLPSGIFAEQTIDPYGLVTKLGEWHVVYIRINRFQVIPVRDVQNISKLEDTFERLSCFDLQEFWQEWCNRHDKQFTPYTVVLHIKTTAQQQILPLLKVRSQNQTDKPGWTSFEVEYNSIEEARDKLLSFGGCVMVITPLELRFSMQDYARQILQNYPE